MKKLICLLCVSSVLLLPLVAAGPKREIHREIHAAINALEEAKQVLEQGGPGAGGNRKDDGRRKALEACDRAIQQLRSVLNARRR